MRYIKSPQLSNLQIEYTIGGDAVTATIDGLSETWDFSGMPDGQADEITAEILPLCPIQFARRIDGVLEVSILAPYTNPETAELFPDWQEVD